jgi:hypothetical protein
MWVMVELSRFNRWFVVCLTFGVLLSMPTRAAFAVCPDGTRHEQEIGSDFAIIHAEDPTTPGTGWTEITPPPAEQGVLSTYRGSAVRAATMHAVISYTVQFKTPGTYKVYVRSKGFGSTSNSILVPGGGDPESPPTVALGLSTTGEWAWRSSDSFPRYVIDDENVNRPLQFRIKVNKLGAEVDEIFFGRTGGTFNQNVPYYHAQKANGVLAFEAEDFDHRSGNQGFSVEEDPLAHDREVIRADSTASGPDLKGFVTYLVQFSTPGTYLVYVRGRAYSDGTDSVFVPSFLNAAPNQIVTLAPDDTWTWRTKCCTGLTVGPGDVGAVRELRIGVREPNARIDSVVVVPTTATRTAEELDAMSGFWEAELASNKAVEAIHNDVGASKGQGVRLKNNSQYVEFSSVPSTEELLLRYSLGTTRSKRASLYINGFDLDTVVFTPTGSWNNYATTRIKGFSGGSVKLKIDPDDLLANQSEESARIDRLSLPKRDAQEECLIRSPEDLAVAMDAMGEDPWEDAWGEAGDTIVLASGANLDNAMLEFPATVAGTADQPIVIRSQTAGEPTFTQGSSIVVRGNHIVLMDLFFAGNGDWTPCDQCDVEVSGMVGNHRAAVYFLGEHNRITNTAFDTYYAEPFPPVPPEMESKKDFGMVYIEGRYNRVDHSSFNRNLTKGASVFVNTPSEDDPSYETVYPQLDRNYFGNRPTAASNGYSFVRFGDGNALSVSANTWDNYFENFMTEDSNPGESEFISSKSSDNYYLFNTFVNVRQLLVLRHGNGAFVFGNTFWGSGGIRVHGSGNRILNNYFNHLGTLSDIPIVVGNGKDSNCNTSPGYAPVQDLVIAFNTIDGTTELLQLGDSHGCVPPTSVVIANNLAWDCSNGGPCTSPPHVRYRPDAPPANFLYVANFFQQARFCRWNSNATECSDLEIPSGVTTTDAPGPADTNPLFAVLVDIDGQLRPTTGAPDIGADENAPGPIYVPPLLPNDTGPTWWAPE